MTKPFIGISGNILRDNGGPYVDLLRSYVNQDYPRSIEETGGIPIIIPFTENLDVARETVARLDGLLLSGGHDVYPLHYGEEPLQGLGDVFPERDQFDFALIKAAEEKQIPIFCICRGLQILNVYRGGSLFQDLKYDQNCTIKHSQNQTPSLGTHTVEIDSKSDFNMLLFTSWDKSEKAEKCSNLSDSLSEESFIPNFSVKVSKYDLVILSITFLFFF